MNPVAELTFMGRASVKIKYLNGKTIYIDPYAGTDDYYAERADLILVTHQHPDHNQIQKVVQDEHTKIIQCPMDIRQGQSRTNDGIIIKAVPAYNENHPKKTCCGYVLQYQGLTLYHSGDTSLIDEMKDLKLLEIHYALLCMDGYYNMGPEEAMEAALKISPQFTIPIHTHKEALYDEEQDLAFTLDNKVSVKPGETITLYI